MTRKWWLSIPAAVAFASCSNLVLAQSHCSSPPTEPAGPWAGAKIDTAEGFEDGTLELEYGNGFSWDTSRRMSISTTGYTGSRALQFNYPSGYNGFSEQRFTMGGIYPEVWIGYWLKIPKNWSHGSSGPAGNNNKFFAIWMDEYEKVGPTGVIQIRGRDGDSYISPYVRTRANKHLGELPGKMLIDVPNDRGRWMQVVLHAKMASSSDRHDGIWEMYRRWEGDKDYEQIFSVTDWDNYHVGGRAGFAKGYILGWFNAEQSAATEWLLDDLVISPESLLNAGKAGPDSPSPSKPTIPQIITP